MNDDESYEPYLVVSCDISQDTMEKGIVNEVETILNTWASSHDFITSVQGPGCLLLIFKKK